MGEGLTPEIDGILRRRMIRVPKEIDAVSGIRIFGKLIKSIVFTQMWQLFAIVMLMQL